MYVVGHDGNEVNQYPLVTNFDVSTTQAVANTYSLRTNNISPRGGRFNNDGSIDNRKISLRRRSKKGSYTNPFMRNGDLIIVGESFFTATNQVINEITSPFVGLFSTYGLIKAISD